jgi:hypothetical protein
MNIIPNFLRKLFKKDEPVKFDTFYLNASLLSNEQVELVKACRKHLIENKIPINKIKLVFEMSFTYDVDKSVINPTYKQLIPDNKKYPVIEVEKPLNTMTVVLGENRTYNNYELLKQLTKKSKRGIALLVNDDYDEVMWLANLDEAVDYYNTMNDYDTD